MQISSWRDYYWAFTKEFGKKCYETWKEEALISLVAIMFVYLINRNEVDVKTAMLAISYTLALFVPFHIFRVSWILFKKNKGETLPESWGVIGIVFGLGALLLAVWTAAWFYTMQPTVRLFRAPDSRDVTIVQLQAQMDAFKEHESPDSLRRRTMKVADEVYDYLEKRERNHPPRAYPNSSEPNPSEERRKMIQQCLNYDQQTLDYHFNHFRDRMVGIVREYNARGVRTGFLENDFTQRVPVIAFPGSPWEGTQIDELGQFRDLAYRVDARGNLITF